MNQPPHISLVGAETHVRKIEAIKEVRRVADWNLKRAKEAVDAVLCGTDRIIPLVGDTDAEEVARRFASLGFVVKVNDQSYTPPEGRSYSPKWSKRQRGAVEVRTLRDFSAMGLLRVDARLTSGSADAGDHLGLPLNGSTVVVLLIERVTQRDDGVVIEMVGNAEDFEFWNAMNVIGDELPVLKSDSP